MATDLQVQRRLLDATSELTSAAESSGNTAALARLKKLKEGLTDGKLRIALVGESGNGKSTLANALIGNNLLPTGSVASTRILGDVRYGEAPVTTLCYADGVRTRIEPSLLPEIGPDLVERLDHLEVESPAPFLEHAVVVDVPGLTGAAGSQRDPNEDTLFAAHCLVCVLNCDRLLSMTERTYIEERFLRYDAERICFVLNRSDGKTPEELEALTDRARHLLSPIVPDPAIFPFSALQALQRSSSPTAAVPKKGQSNRGESAPVNPDPAGLVELITRDWIAERQSIITAAACLKIGAIAAAIDEGIHSLQNTSGDRLQSIESDLHRLERERLDLQERTEAMSRRATASVQALREQFVVGLKDFALKLRESVPLQVMEVAPDDAKRFLPFYIQDSLRRAVEENDRPLNAAVAHVLESLGQEIGPAVQTLVDRFQVDVEPPVIPLYVARDRAVLSQGASYLLWAGTAAMLSDALIGGLVLAGGFMTREIGRQLEAADRRAALADGAQRLVHGSISTMEGSVTEQFTELEKALAQIVRETYAPELDAQRIRLEEIEADRSAALTQQAEAERAAESGRAHIATARQLIREIGMKQDEPPAKRQRRSSRTARTAAGEPADAGGDASREAQSSDGTIHHEVTGLPDAGA